MRYYRKVVIGCAHFNGEKTYEHYNRYVINKEFEKDLRQALFHLEEVVKDLHGHNFVVEVWAKGKSRQLDEQNFFVDDLWIEDTVKEWDRTNLTLLDEFRDYRKDRQRVSLEVMVLVLTTKIKKKYPELRITVRIHETDEQYAEHTL